MLNQINRQNLNEVKRPRNILGYHCGVRGWDWEISAIGKWPRTGLYDYHWAVWPMACLRRSFDNMYIHISSCSSFVRKYTIAGGVECWLKTETLILKVLFTIEFLRYKCEKNKNSTKGMEY